MLVALNERAFLCKTDSERLLELLQPGSDASDKIPENPIQGVSVVEDEERVWCAVSRLNKTLAIYLIDWKSKVETVVPRTVHFTIKRVVGLAFGHVPYSVDENTEQSMLVCLTAGLTGDAWAFSLEEAGKKRLLLGHTASMLTGIRVQGNTLLTSDRDEKIRVTSFPDTAVIKGYLLGHEAYIAAIDIASSQKASICVSCSGGDKTVRIWNYATLELLATWDLKKESTRCAQIPSRVGVDTHGITIGVIYDQSNILDILRVEEKDGSNYLKVDQSIECSAQPLSVVFMEGYLFVSMKEPAFIQAYLLHNKAWQIIDLAACVALRRYAAEAKISMPDSVLEKDKDGQATMSKLSETRGSTSKPVEKMPWNRSGRIEIAKERNKRHKRRRHKKKEEQ